ncbi:Wall-associated kinase family protein [Rhynchospora pubera]|uniref:Wall-associated kinase family protein n=1 Tax=Rhynchospora pubera TaxID=906938 RepID=A0AAV8EJE2_9POAL|nr:Wall-associated kinase family protein [Rhynchospora pubera]
MKEFSYRDIEVATEGFSLERLIGKGSHGSVYKGRLRCGKVIAVKKPSIQGESKLENEINILGSINNSSIVNLIGFSHTPTKTKLLIMEFMPNGSLHDLTHMSPTPPSWTCRVHLSLQIARAILSLHEGAPSPVIHRDIKSTNILLDSKHKARLSDFGLAVSDDSRQADRPVMPAGTIGYIDPCYTESGQLGPENDVYSFGILLLEIMSSRKVFDFDSDPSCIVSWAVPLIKFFQYEKVCDKRLPIYSNAEKSAVAQILHIAERCLSENVESRPMMREVVKELQEVVQCTRWPVWLPFGDRISCSVNRCVRAWKRCVKKRVTTTKIVCKDHLMHGGVDDCGNDGDIQLG